MDFLDELGLFIGEKPILAKKRVRRYAVLRGAPICQKLFYGL
jgi:hypothetical protein